MDYDTGLYEAMKRSIIEAADKSGDLWRAAEESRKRIEESRRLLGMHLAPQSMADVFAPFGSRRPANDER